MGLLTDPSGGQGAFTKALLKYYAKLCVLLYLSGVIWFCLLAHPPINASTYFSENALLPGLVKSQFFEEKAALRYYEELTDELKNYSSSLPYPWLTAKFRQIGLDTYTHNFSLKSPLKPNEKYYGKNVYGILRAAKASSTESLVLSVPYRAPKSAHITTIPSIAVMLAFAKFANREKYWAKDIIFLITEHEQLGAQAWLEAYHGVTCGSENILNHGDLKGHAGAIQAAINLELHSTKIGHIDLKIEGLNGQLPNLDLFNLAAKMCVKEGVYYTFKNKSPEYHRDPIKEWWFYFKNLMLMVSTQATGIPNGNHGLFHRFGIQALTIEGSEHFRARGSTRVGLLSIGRILEGTFRSLNNLLERFHQSFFFYLLPSSDRYISIGLYMPSVCLIVGALLIKACAKWCQLQKHASAVTDKNESTTEYGASYVQVIFIFVLTHLYGTVLMNIPTYVTNWADVYNWNVSSAVFWTLTAACHIPLLSPLFISKVRKSENNMTVLYIFALLELGTALVCISMNNFSLGLICATISAPFALFVTPTTNRFYSAVQKFLWLAVHPQLILFIVILVNTYFMFSTEHSKEVVYKAYTSFKEAAVFSFVDSVIYDSWLFSIVTTVFIPNWLCFFYVTFSNFKQASVVISEEKKVN